MDNKTTTDKVDPKAGWSLEWRKFLTDENVQPLPDGMPLFNWLEISPTELCNRRCEFCPKADRGQFPNQPLMMAPELYMKMAAELKALDYRGIVLLSGYGEPMMYKHIRGIVEAFSPWRIKLVTNGDHLNEDAVAGLFDAGLSMFLISLYDGPEQVERFEQMFAAARAPEYGYVLRPRWDGPDKGFGMKLTNRAGMVQAGNQPLVIADHLCYYPNYAMMVDWNGDVLLCCQDWNRRVKFGNLAHQSMVEAWSSPALGRYRQNLRAGRRRGMPPCSGCNADGTLHGANHVEAWERYYARGAS